MQIQVANESREVILLLYSTDIIVSYLGNILWFLSPKYSFSGNIRRSMRIGSEI
jgi:hypothetical protein